MDWENGSMNSKFIKIYPYIPISVGLAFLFLPSLISGKVIFWGTPSLQFIPWMATAFDNVLAGHLPLWNPLNGMGAPLLANYQTAYLYPVNWLLFPLYLIQDTPGLAWGYTLLLMVHLFWAGIGMLRLLKSLNIGFLGQAVGSAAYGLGGYLIARSGFTSMIWSAAWLPWIVLCAGKIAHSKVEWKKPDKYLLTNWLYLVGCVAMQLLTGHAQLTWYSLLFAMGWVVFVRMTTGGMKKTFRTVILFGLAGMVAAGLTAIQLLPTIEYLLQSQRAAAVDFSSAMTYSFWGWRFLSFLTPDLFGNPGMGDYWGYASYWEDAVYIGLLPFLLALSTLGSVFLKKRRFQWFGEKRLVIFLWLWVLVGAILALGQNTPIFPFLYRYIPTFDMFNAPARYMLWCVFALSILAGIGTERWRTPTGRGLYVLRLATAGAFAVSMGAFFAWGFLKDIDATFIRATALAGMWGVGAGLLTLFQPAFSTQPSPDSGFIGGGIDQPVEKISKIWLKYFWFVLVAVWITSDLIVSDWLLVPKVNSSFYSDTAGDNLNLAGSRLFIPADNEYTLKFNKYFQFADYAPGVDWSDLHSVMLPNLNLLHDVVMVNNFDPLLPGRYKTWMEQINLMIPILQIPYLKLMDVRQVEIIDPYKDAGIVFEEINSPSRYRWYTCAKFVSSEKEALESVFENNQIPDYLVIEGEEQNGWGACSPGQEPEVTWEAVDGNPNQKLLHINTTEDGWLMIADTWYPGWIARIDKTPMTLYRANYLFMGLYIEEGSHSIEINYRPVSFYAGALISFFSALFLILIFWFFLKNLNF